MITIASWKSPESPCVSNDLLKSGLDNKVLRVRINFIFLNTFCLTSIHLNLTLLGIKLVKCYNVYKRLAYIPQQNSLSLSPHEVPYKKLTVSYYLLLLFLKKWGLMPLCVTHKSKYYISAFLRK